MDGSSLHLLPFTIINRSLDFKCRVHLKLWFLKLYLGHILKSLVSQWRMSVSLGLREPDRLLLENIAVMTVP